MSQGEWHLLWVIKGIRAWGRSQRESHLPQYLWAEIVTKPYYLLSPMAETVFWHCMWLIPRSIHKGRATNMVAFESMKINMQVFTKMATHTREHVQVARLEGECTLWLTHKKMCITTNQSTWSGRCTVGKRTVRHRIEFFSLKKTTLTIYMEEVKSQIIQSGWTGNYFFFPICRNTSRSHWMKFSRNRCKNKWKKVLSIFEWLNNGTYYHRILWS